MNYRIVYDKGIVKDYRKLGKKLTKRIDAKILKDLKTNPYRNPILVDSKIELRRHRIGSYRALYVIAEEEKEVHILWVQHRKDVYKNL